mgnify:CR=1 FL=1
MMLNQKDILEEAEERFCIMAEQSDVGDVQAGKFIAAKYGREIALKVWKKLSGKNSPKK